MSSRTTFFIWVFVTLFLIWEHLTINSAPGLSVLTHLKSSYPDFQNMTLSTQSGKNYGYSLGWIGFLTMCLTNLYILRKRYNFMVNVGKTQNWLNFHILCGMLGPTFIIFHTNFKVGGLVAISFWSMMIVALSGVIGKYFYVQVVGEMEAIRKKTRKWEKALADMASPHGIPDEKLESWKRKAVRYVGADVKKGKSDLVFILNVIMSSMIGDIRLAFAYPSPIPALKHPQSNVVLCNYALSKRQGNYLEPFKKLLGYWHTFHVPFAVMMYVAAIIHIAVALTFQVKTH